MGEQLHGTGAGCVCTHTPALNALVSHTLFHTAITYKDGVEPKNTVGLESPVFELFKPIRTPQNQPLSGQLILKCQAVSPLSHRGCEYGSLEVSEGLVMNLSGPEFAF